MNNELYIINDNRSKRLDVLKVLFAIFVVLIHANLSASFLLGDEWLSVFKYTISKVVCSIANNGFFLISSILLYSRSFSWLSNIKKKVRSLLIPYLLLNLSHILLYNIGKITILKGILNATKILSKISLMDVLGEFGILSRVPINDPTWFIRNLFVLNLLSVIIKKVIDKAPRLALFSLIIYSLFSRFDFYYLIYPTNLLFWCLGYYIVKYNINTECLDNKTYITFLYCAATFSKVILHYNKIGMSYSVKNLIDIVYHLISLIFWYSIFSYNTNGYIQKKLTYYSKYSFPVYLLHATIIISLHRIVLNVFPQTTLILLLAYVLLPVITICISLFIAMYLERYFPNLYSLLIGNRKRNI